MRPDDFKGWSGFAPGDAHYAFLQDPVSLSPSSPKNSIVEFLGTGTNGRLDLVFALGRFVWSVEPPNARRLLEYEDGTPAVLQFQAGKGATVFVNIPLDDSESNLVRKAVFLPLLHELLKLASPLADARTEFLLGQDSIQIAGPPGMQAAKLAGSDVQIKYDPATGASAVRGALGVGAYTVAYTGEGKKDSRAFSVNLPKGEAVLSHVKQEEFAARFARSTMLRPGDEFLIASSGSFDLNDLLLPLLLAIFLMELWLANTFYKSANIEPAATGNNTRPAEGSNAP